MTQTAEAETPQENPGILKLGDKWYVTVAARLKEFRESEKYDGWSLWTEVTHGRGSVMVKACVANPEGRVIATGHSEKPWAKGVGNNRQGIERAETGAIGRALVALGLLADHGIASWEEVADSVLEERDTASKELAKLKEHTRCISDNLKAVHTIHRAILAERWDVAVEWFYSLAEQDQIALFGVAPSRGGIWSTAERKLMKEGEGFREAKKAYFEALNEDREDEE